MSAAGRRNGHDYSITPTSWGYELTVDGEHRGYFDDYEWAERTLERFVADAQPYQIREVQNGAGARFGPASFGTLHEAWAAAEAYSIEWGVTVEVVEIRRAVVRVLATCLAGVCLPS